MTKGGRFVFVVPFFAGSSFPLRVFFINGKRKMMGLWGGGGCCAVDARNCMA